MEKPKNLYVPPMDMNLGGRGYWWEDGCRTEGNKEKEKNGTRVLA